MEENTEELVDQVTAMEENTATSEELGEDHQQMQQLAEQVTQVENASNQQQNLNEKLQRLKQQFRRVHKRTIETYLRDKSDNEHINIQTLSDVYIELRVHNSEQYKRLDERSDLNSLELQTDIEHCEPIEVQELFSADARSGETPLKVLVTGKAGIGKTMLAMCLLNKWLEDQLPSIEHVFFFSMRELSPVRECSLADLLFTHQGIQKPSDDIIEECLKLISQNSLVIFEGLDEHGNYTSEEESEAFDYNTKVNISKLIGSIICGKTLTLARLLVTSRLGGVIEYSVFDQITEIYGFVESRIFEYVSMFCSGNDDENGQLESHIRDYINNNINIRSFCYVPMLCNLVCRIAKLNLEQNSEVPLPTTITQLLTMSVLNFAMEHHPDFKGTELCEDDDVIAHIKDPLLCHAKLAKDGMSRQPVKLLFSKGNIERFQLSHVTATQCGLLTMSREEAQGSLSRIVRNYYFLHLIIQEFLAGITLTSCLEDTKTLMEQTPNEGQLDMVLTFISGLVGDPANKEFLQSLGYQTTMPVEDFLILVVTQERRQRRRDHKTSILLLLMLVYESRQPGLWTEIKDYVLKDGKELNLANTHINPVELQTLIFVMPKWNDINVLDLSNCSIRGTDLVGGLRYLNQLTHLRLEDNKDLHGPAVMTALSDSIIQLTRLEELDLDQCQLNDTDVFQLAPALLALTRLRDLRLQSNSISDIGALRVTEVACTSLRLGFIRLYNNWLTDRGIDLVRRAVHCSTPWPWGKVQLGGLNYQRPPGEEVDHPDQVVNFQRRVANYQLCLSRLNGRRLEDRESYWGQEVVAMEHWLYVVQDTLRLVQRERARESVTEADRQLDQAELDRLLRLAEMS